MSLLLRLGRLPEDLVAFADDVNSFCPDTVEQGVKSIETLAQFIGATGTICLWWD